MSSLTVLLSRMLRGVNVSRRANGLGGYSYCLVTRPDLQLFSSIRARCVSEGEKQQRLASHYDPLITVTLL